MVKFRLGKIAVTWNVQISPPMSGNRFVSCCHKGNAKWLGIIVRSGRPCEQGREVFNVFLDQITLTDPRFR